MEVKEHSPVDLLKIEKEEVSISYDIKDEKHCELESDAESEEKTYLDETIPLIPEPKMKLKKKTKTLAYFTCPHCDLKIVKSNFFVKHVENEHGGGQFPCSFCNLQFSTGEMFTDHVMLTHRNKGGKKKIIQAFFQCSHCDLKTVKSTFYVKHVDNEHPGESLHCSFCELEFETGELFINHVKSFHKKSKVKASDQEGEVFPCIDCKKIFSKLANLEGHKRAVHNIQVHVCEFCCKEFKNKDYCRQHIRLVHESQFQENVVCDVCSKVFKSKSNLYHHRRAVHEVAEDLICYLCATKCKNSYVLRKHLKKCQIRAKREPKTYVLGKDTHIQQLGENFFCSKCNKTFFTPKALRSHNRAAHTFDPVNCHICHRECKNVDYLKQHYRRGHYVMDSDQINAMIKFVKPDYEPASNKKKSKDPNNTQITESKPGLDWLNSSCDFLQNTAKPATGNSESQKIRQELVIKWREMEEEQKRQKEAESLLTSNCIQLEGKEESYSSPDTIHSSSIPSCDDKADLDSELEQNLHVKLEDNESMMPECEVKLEASESECLSDADFNVCDSGSDEEQDTDSKHSPMASSPHEDESGRYFCDECCKSFQSLKYLASHTRTVHTHQPCSCPHCSANFKNPRYLNQHLQRAHKIDSKSAKKQSLNSSEIKSEIKNEEVSKPVYLDSIQTEFPCTDCEKVFSKKHRLSTHMSNMHVVGEYLCQLCGEKFSLKQQLKNHTDKVHAKTDGVCQFCSKSFKNVSSHIKDVHMKEECICPHCAKTFHNKKHLNGHISTVHSGEGQTRICPVCSKQFKNSQYLRQHVRLVHETVEDLTNYITCQECGKQFANKAHLYHHTKAVHVVESCNCTICGRTYKNKIALGKHMKHAHDGMVKNPYSGGVKPNPSQQESSQSQTQSGSSTPTQQIPFQPRLDAFPRSFFGQSGWY